MIIPRQTLPHPSFLRTVIALGYFFVRCFWINWVIRYVLKLILEIYKTTFGHVLGEIYPKNAEDRHNHFQEIR